MPLLASLKFLLYFLEKKILYCVTSLKLMPTVKVAALSKTNPPQIRQYGFHMSAAGLTCSHPASLPPRSRWHQPTLVPTANWSGRSDRGAL